MCCRNFLSPENKVIRIFGNFIRLRIWICECRDKFKFWFITWGSFPFLAIFKSALEERPVCILLSSKQLCITRLKFACEFAAYCTSQSSVAFVLCEMLYVIICVTRQSFCPLNPATGKICLATAGQDLERAPSLPTWTSAVVYTR
jgi:hypothetical protein